MRWALVSCVLWPTVAFAERIDPPGAAATDKLAGQVLVWNDAVLHVDDTEKSLTLKLAKLDDRKTALGEVFPAKVVSAKGDRLEIELVSAQPCSNVIARIDHVDGVRFFVSRKDLAPVLVKPYSIKHKNGSQISMRPGQPVLPTQSGAFVVAIGSGEVEVDVPTASVGHAYKPSKVTSSQAGEDGFILGTSDAPTEVTLGVQTFTLDRAWAAKVQKRKMDTVFPLGSACVNASVLAPPEAVRRGGMRSRLPHIVNESCQAGCPDPTWIFPKGTVLRTPAGRVVGRAAADIDVFLSTSTDDSQQICREVEVGFVNLSHQRPGMRSGSGPRRMVDVCVPTKQTRTK